MSFCEGLILNLSFVFIHKEDSVATERQRESTFQSRLIAKLKKRFPGCIILKNDEQYCQGIPDLVIFYKDRWAMLECKASAKASHRPNQDYYISKLSKMSFAAFVFPENEEEVLDGLARSLES